MGVLLVAAAVVAVAAQADFRQLRFRYSSHVVCEGARHAVHDGADGAEAFVKDLADWIADW